MFSIVIAIIPKDYLSQRSPNSYEEWILLLQFGSHLDVEGVNLEPALVPTIGTFIKVRPLFSNWLAT